MTQIFTGQGQGLQGSSLGLGAYGPKGVASLGQGGESVYVNAANGNLVLKQKDGFLADLGFGLDLFQTYNSQGEKGSSWCFNWDSRLECASDSSSPGTSIIRIGEDGHKNVFVWDDSHKCYMPEEGGTASINLEGFQWVYKEGSDSKAYYYNLEGQLREVSDRDGHKLTFEYQEGHLIRIQDTKGQQSISWMFHQGLLREVKASSNGEVLHHLRYEYDDKQRLCMVRKDLGQGKSFWIAYDYEPDSSRIQGLRQSDGTALYLQYDALGRVRSLKNGEGQITRYEYLEGRTILSDALGASWTYYYDDHQRLTGVDGPELYRLRYEYEGNQLKRMIQGNSLWHFEYNDVGDCIKVKEPTGEITERVYNDRHQLLEENHSAKVGNVPLTRQRTRYAYDELAHLRFSISAEGIIKEYRYNEEGLLLNTRTYLHSDYELEDYDLQSLMHWTSLQSVQDISLIEYRYDGLGQLMEEVHYAQVDAIGQGIAQSATRTQFLYDGAGRLVKRLVPLYGGLSVTSYFYDGLGRLIQTLDNQNHSQLIEYDDAHQRIIQTDAQGLQTVSLYDKNGLLLSVTRLDSKKSYGTTTYTYDALGHLIAETRPDGLSMYTFYNDQGRIKATVSAGGQAKEYLYNEQGQIIQTRDYAFLLNPQGWLERMPSWAQVKPVSQAQDRLNQMIYNDAQQLVYSLDAQGAILAYEYDVQGHLLRTKAYAQKVKNFNPEQLWTCDTLKPVVDGQDRITSYYYDKEGRLQAEVNGEGWATEYRYTRLGQIWAVVRYSTKVTLPLAGSWIDDKPQEDRRDIYVYSFYDGRGLKIGEIDGERYVTEYFYDAQGLITERKSYAQVVPTRTLIDEFTTLASLRPISQPNDHGIHYEYDDLGQLKTEKTYSGLITTYSYDEEGRLLTKTLEDSDTHALRQQRYRYDALGRIIQSLNETGAANLLQTPGATPTQIEAIWQQHSTHFEYNEVGLLTRKTNPLKQSTYYFYDATGNLRYTVTDEGVISETSYTVFGEVAQTRNYSRFWHRSTQDLSTNELTQSLKALQDERFDEVRTWDYNTLGQIIGYTEGGQKKWTQGYNAFGETQWHTQTSDAAHETTNTWSYDKRGLVIQSVEDIHGLAKTQRTKYNAFGWISVTEDGLGRTYEMLRNKRGELVAVFDPREEFKQFSYDAFGRIVWETDYTHTFYQKRFEYDDVHNTLSVTEVGIRAKIKTQFNAFGDTVAITDAMGQTTSFYYDEKGQLIQKEAPENATTRYQYDELGHCCGRKKQKDYSQSMNTMLKVMY